MESNVYGRTEPIECTTVQIREGPIDSPTPEKAPLSKRGICARDAQKHATTWSYRRVRQPLVIPCRSHPEEEWGSA
jgi:hypothetical protein